MVWSEFSGQPPDRDGAVTRGWRMSFWDTLVRNVISPTAVPSVQAAEKAAEVERRGRHTQKHKP